jgi:hypothetical protein
VLNANDWFLNNSGVPRSFDNANQWAASIGGPIKKDKTFFFLDTEGLRLLIPTSQPVNIPSPQFQAATLAEVRHELVVKPPKSFKISSGCREVCTTF